MVSSYPYIVRGIAKGGTVTYNCPSPEWAVRKHRDMVVRELADVTIGQPPLKWSALWYGF